MARPTPSADPAALMARRRAARLERERVAQDRWTRFQDAARRRYGPRLHRIPPVRLGRLLARGKWPGRVLLLAASGLWHSWLEQGLGAPGETATLLDYVRAGPDRGSQPKALFDQARYIARAPQIASTAWAPLAHYLVLGDREGRDPHPLFHVAGYRAEVGAPLGRPTTLQHFLFQGAAEGLNPHPLFDLRFYVGQSEEVARSGENPLVHYLRKGWREGLDPHPLFVGAWYLSRYADAAAAGAAPLLHYVAEGWTKGYDPHPLFDAAYWAEQSGGGTAAEPLAEFLRSGGPARKSPTPHFNPGYYVQQLGGAPEVQANPLLHYLTVGAFDGAWPAADFDESAYLAAYPAAADSGLAALDHWVRHRTARPAPSATASVILSPDALAANIRAATTPDAFAYDWGAYETLSREWRRGRRTMPEASPLASAGRLEVVPLAPDGLDAARAAVARTKAEVVVLAEAGLAGVEGWAEALLDAAREGAARPAMLADSRISALAVRRDLLAETGLDEAARTAEGLLTDLVLKLRARGTPVAIAHAARLVRSGPAPAWPTLDVARDRQRLMERAAEALEAQERVQVIALRVTSAPDWEAVETAKPSWRGHLQPRLPGDLGAYDVAAPATLRRQAELAARYGVSGFCHEVADASSASAAWAADAPDIPFCLAWTGGDTPKVLAALGPGLMAANAIRVDERPLLLLAAEAKARAWRAAARTAGLPDLYLVQRGGPADVDPRALGFDARLDEAPLPAPRRPTGPSFNPHFAGEIHDYRAVVRAAFETADRPWPEIPLVRAGRDTTPADPDGAAVFHDASPGAFQAWLEWALERARLGGERIVFVDAWNDWMRGAVLEPDRRLGHGWLEAVANARDAELLDR